MNDTNDTRRPPKTLEQMRALVALIRRDEAGFRLGSRARQCFERLVEAPRRTAVSSISELAQATGVNASTLTRLSRKLGFKGFNEFQDVFRSSISGEAHVSGARGEAPELGDGDEANSGARILARSAGEQRVNIAATAENLAHVDIDGIAARLLEARRVKVFGTRQMVAAASTLSYGLGMLRSDVDMLVASEHGIAHAIAQLGRQDLIVMLSNAPHTRATLELARIIAGQGIGLITISDSHDCPLGLESEQAIVCETGSSFFGPSAVAVVAAIEGLLTVAVARLGAGSLREVRRRERLISELEVAVVGS